jgi:hypothetical protein
MNPDDVGKVKITLLYDEIIDYFDDQLTDGNFDACDDALDAVDVDDLDTYHVVAYLSATRRAAPKLKRRADFVRRAHERLTVLAPDRVDSLMSNLD